MGRDLTRSRAAHLATGGPGQGKLVLVSKSRPAWHCDSWSSSMVQELPIHFFWEARKTRLQPLDGLIEFGEAGRQVAESNVSVHFAPRTVLTPSGPLVQSRYLDPQTKKTQSHQEVPRNGSSGRLMPA